MNIKTTLCASLVIIIFLINVCTSNRMFLKLILEKINPKFFRFAWNEFKSFDKTEDVIFQINPKNKCDSELIIMVNRSRTRDA